MQYLVHVFVFYLWVLVLCVVRPGAGHVFVGIFFLVMAIGINSVLVLVAPDLFVALGTVAPLIPLYPWFFENFVALSPQLFGLLAAAYEITIALTMLCKGRYAKWGLFFLLAITPLGVWTLANPVMTLALLLRKKCERSLPEILWFGLGSA